MAIWQAGLVALFLVAEPMKRLGKYTFTDALDSKFNSKSIQLMAAISTLLVVGFLPDPADWSGPAF